MMCSLALDYRFLSEEAVLCLWYACGDAYEATCLRIFAYSIIEEEERRMWRLR